MVATREGGIKSRDKILARDPDHYKNIGAKGGRNGNTGGFASMDAARLREVSRKGGRISKRRVATSQQDDKSGPSDSTSNTQRTTTPLATSSSTSRNVKPSRRMSSFLGRFRKEFRG